MTIRRMAALAATSTLILGGTLAATASPAQAAPPAPPGNCPNQSVCGYVGERYLTSEGYEIIPFSSAGACEGVGLRNQWTSVFNNSGRSIRLYKNTGCGNGVWTLANGTGLTNMALLQPAWNDQIESIRF